MVMEEFKLYTRGAAGFHVTTVMIPEFHPRVEGLVWGERSFFWNEERNRYEEGVLFVVGALQDAANS
jgi:hypothetical protein